MLFNAFCSNTDNDNNKSDNDDSCGACFSTADVIVWCLHSVVVGYFLLLRIFLLLLKMYCCYNLINMRILNKVQFYLICVVCLLFARSSRFFLLLLCVDICNSCKNFIWLVLLVFTVFDFLLTFVLVIFACCCCNFVFVHSCIYFIVVVIFLIVVVVFFSYYCCCCICSLLFLFAAATTMLSAQ